jgi:membrane associated rhomboid family serine protease
LYLGGGVAASLAPMASDPTSEVPALVRSHCRHFGLHHEPVPAVARHRRGADLVLPLSFEVHAFVFIGLWFLLQILQGTIALLEPSEGGVAWWAHVGFVAGLLIGPLLLRPVRHYRIYQPDEG